MFLAGPGVSEKSGVSNFRKEDGMFFESLNNFFSTEQIVSYTFFRKYPEEFYKFYREKLIHSEAKPNDCHMALVELGRKGKLKAIVTENIDGLHQMAGSKKVYELNGSVHRNYCTRCGGAHNATYVLNAEGVPTCTRCGDVVKPDIVLYGERPDVEIMEYIIYCIMNADTVILGGTSLNNYSIAKIINNYFRGENMVIIDEAEIEDSADLVIQGNVADVMKQAVENMQ